MGGAGATFICLGATGDPGTGGLPPLMCAPQYRSRSGPRGWRRR
jgi:hypothetical protein